MITLIFLTWYFGAHVNAYYLVRNPDVIDDYDEFKHILHTVAVSMIWPYYWAVKLLDSVHVNLLPGPGETA